MLLQGKCTALTEYTGRSHVIDDPKHVEGRREDQHGRDARSRRRAGRRSARSSAASHRARRTRRARCSSSSGSRSSRSRSSSPARGGSAAVTGSALHDPAAVKKYRWLPAIADAVNTRCPKPRTPDEPKMEDILGTRAQRGAGRGDRAEERLPRDRAEAPQLTRGDADHEVPQAAGRLLLDRVVGRGRRREASTQRAWRLRWPPRPTLLLAACAPRAGRGRRSTRSSTASAPASTSTATASTSGRRGRRTTRDIYHDPVFWQAMETTAKFVVLRRRRSRRCSASLLALLVARELRVRSLIRVALILPMTIAPVVVGVIWRLIYASDIGIVNPLFAHLGLGTPNVLAHYNERVLRPRRARHVGVDTAALPDHPRGPPLAAAGSARGGAGRRRHAVCRRSSTTPCRCSCPVLLVAVTLRTIDAVGTFDQIFVLTGGGPGTSTQLISIYSYNTAFQFTQYGQAMAMLVTLLAFLLLLMIGGRAVHPAELEGGGVSPARRRVTPRSSTRRSRWRSCSRFSRSGG